MIERWHHWPGRNRYQIFSADAVALLAVTSSSGGTLPRLEGKSLAGKNVVLPDDARGSAAILIFGFTRASRSNTEAWSRRLADDKTLSGVKIYNLPVLESVPRIFRGWVVSGIQKSVPVERRANFVPLFAKEKELKQVAGFSSPNDPYLVVLDRSGEVRFKYAGEISEAAYSSMLQKLISINEADKIPAR